MLTEMIASIPVSYDEETGMWTLQAFGLFRAYRFLREAREYLNSQPSFTLRQTLVPRYALLVKKLPSKEPFPIGTRVEIVSEEGHNLIVRGTEPYTHLSSDEVVEFNDANLQTITDWKVQQIQRDKLPELWQIVAEMNARDKAGRLDR